MSGKGAEGEQGTKGTKGTITSLVPFLSLVSLVSLLPTPTLADSPTFHGGYQRTGRFAATGPVGSRVLWKFQAGGSIVASPVLGPDGTVYLAATDGRLSALRPDGSKKWEFQAEESLFATPSLDSSGRLYFGDLDGWFYSLTDDGALRWKHRVAEGTDRRILGSAAVTPEGVSLVVSWNNQLYALGPEGSLLWQTPLSGLPTSAPAVDDLGNVYIASLDATNPSYLALHKFTAASPTPLWIHRAALGTSSNRVISTPAIDSSRDRVYVGASTTTAGLVIALDLREGGLVFQKPLPKGIISSPAVREDGTILVGCLDGRLYALEPGAGAEQWAFKTDGPYIFGSPAVDRLGTAYVGDSDGNVYAISPGGRKLWQLTSGSNVESAPVVDAGRLYVTSFDSTLYVVATRANRRPRQGGRTSAGSVR